MSVKHVCILMLIFLIKFSVCERRIVKGIRTYGQKRYMVYLVKSGETADAYDSWLCGGALVTTSQILTSAACIVEIDNIYAIAGYRKYVNGMDIDKDNCTKVKKQRVVKIRVPREHIAHVKEYANTTQWMTIDIGIATVEQPYDFEDVTFRIFCSYIPAAIQINYDSSLDTKIGTNVVALGWGRNRGSKNRDLVDRNSETLREVSIKIKQKADCIKQFKGNGLSEMIDKYMICTHGKGLLDGEGYLIEEMDKKNNRCRDIQRGAKNADMYDDCFDADYDFEFAVKRRSIKSGVGRNNTRRRASNYNKNKSASNSGTAHTNSRRQGICQNDHGGPLITWVGSTEMIIGVAVNSLYDDQFNCVGPYIFISTAAAGQIVKCLLANENPTRKSCPVEQNEGYEIFEDVATIAPVLKVAHVTDGTPVADKANDATVAGVTENDAVIDFRAQKRKEIGLRAKTFLKTDADYSSIEVVTI